MYRLAAVFTIIFFSAQVFGADSRVERWNQRIERMKKIQDNASPEKFDKPLLDKLISSGIKSSEEFISILGRYSDDDGTLKTGAKKYSLPEIESRVKDTSSSAISLFLLSGIYSSFKDPRITEKISADINAYAVKHFGDSIKFTAAELKILTRDYIYEMSAGEYDSAVKKLTSDILSKTEYELSRTDYNSNDTDILKIISRHASETLSGSIFPMYSGLNEVYLSAIPQWKLFTSEQAKIKKRDTAIMNFIHTVGSLEANPTINSAVSAEDEIFIKAKSKISHLLNNTTQSNGPTGNNPYYVIPDTGKLIAAIDEIDKYRYSMMRSISGSENVEFISKIARNNTGIAYRHSNRIDAQFRAEEARIARLKKIKGDIIIYNEELFKTARSHFYEVREEINRYAKLSADFLETFYSAGKNEPGEFTEFHKYKTERYIKYMSFAEKLTSDTIALSASGIEKIDSRYKGTIPSVLSSSKDLIKPEPIPSTIRAAMNREELKEYGSINADFRIRGYALIKALRKNYDDCIAGISLKTAQKKESALSSEGRIAQDETDRLFAFAKSCSDILYSMNRTENFLKLYSNEYTRLIESIKKGDIPSKFTSVNREMTLISQIRESDPAAIERETATREVIAREGMEALSGAITIAQYYKRKGISIKFEPTPQEIASIKLAFSRSPEVTISSWRMNGNNFRQIDLNLTAVIRKLLAKNAWDNNNKSASEILTLKETGLNISFAPPAGWKKISMTNENAANRIIYESPDKTGTIELTTISEDENNIQSLASAWPEKSGYSMVEKNWGTKNNTSYIRCTSKNSFNRIMESYMIASNGRIIILSGKTSRDLYRKLNRMLSDVFNNLEIEKQPLKFSLK